jgi:glycerol-3-phosphate acyltransferase PlsY
MSAAATAAPTALAALGVAGPGVVVLGAYLLGSIPWSYLIVKLTQGRDVRTVGSGNAGATNVMRAAGKAAGLAALLLDAGKGVTAVVVARALGAGPGLTGAAAAAAVAGHVFPLFLGFRGGKGVAAAGGALGALAPAVLAIDLLLFVGVVAWKRYISLGSIVAAAAFPLLLALFDLAGWRQERSLGTVAAAAAIAALILVRHRANFDRLRRGVESRLGEPRRAAPAAVDEAP